MRVLLSCILWCGTVFHVVGAEQDFQAEYFARAIPSAEGFAKRLTDEGPWPNLGVRSLIDNAYILAFADRWKPGSTSLELTIPLLKLAEEMQDQNLDNQTFGNLRWYWRTPEVTDRNAVEFVAAHALPIWFDARERLPEESKAILERILRRAIEGCIVHRVSPDYTNIAIFNAVNLILLGESFDRPDAVKLGKERLESVMACFWDHGVYEYVSPTYYSPDVDTLQLGLRYVKDEQLKATFRHLLDFFWTDMAINWYKPSLRMSGAQSRTYHYLLGVTDSSRLYEFAGLAPRNPRASSVSYLSSFNAAYTPPQEILALTENYPRQINQRWGVEQGQWRTTFVLDDIALGTAGAAYGRVKQNMILTVDLADYAEMPAGDVRLLPRNYFISDGREDPYGTNSYPTSAAGHNKALHMDQVWIGAQETVDAIGVALYPAWTLDENVMTNVQSHFVFRKPDAMYVNGQKVDLESNVAKPLGNGTLILRHGSRAIGVRVPWTRHRDGSSPIPYLIDDGNRHGVSRLTVDHWPKDEPVTAKDLGDAPGIALWVRVGSHLDSEEKFEAWCNNFRQATVEKLDIQNDNISLHVAGIDGPVRIDRRKLSEQGAVVDVVPSGPNGILMLDGKDLGRPILERIPLLASLSQKMGDLKPVVVDTKGAEWEAETGFSLLDYLTEDNDTASGGKAVRVNNEFYWLLDVKDAGTYYLWARVLALDPQHDSFRIEWRSQDGQRFGGDWHLGQGPTWRWIPLTLNAERPVVPLELTPGPWRLTLRPREMDGCVDQLILSTDPNFKPPL